MKKEWNNKYKKVIRITEKDLKWIKKEKGKWSCAKFLEEIINNYKNKKDE